MAAAMGAFEAASKMTPIATTDVAEDRRERYFFYAGNEPGMPGPGGLSVQSKCIPNLKIRRCEVTPCLTVQVMARKEEIPDGSKVRGSEDFSKGTARFWLYSGAEAAQLIADYGNKMDSSKNWGLVELTELTGIPVAEVAQLRITETFFEDYPNIPASNSEIEKKIWATMERLTYTDVPGRTLLLSIGDKMIESVRAAQRHMEDVITQTNIAVTLPSTEPGYKRSFDEKDILFSACAGIPLATNALRQNSSNQMEMLVEKLSEKQGASVDVNLIGSIVAATMAAMQGQIVPAPAPIPEPPVATEPVIVDDAEEVEPISNAPVKRRRR